MSGAEDEVLFYGDILSKTVQKLSMSAAHYAKKSPGLSSFCMAAGYDLTRTDSGELDKATTHFCPFCGTIYDSESSRVRYKPKKLPSNGRWANLLSRTENLATLSSNTRCRMQKFLKARNRTLITCLKCGNVNRIDGATRMPRDETANRVRDRSREEVTSQKRKKKKRRKEVNAGLNIKRSEDQDDVVPTPDDEPGERLNEVTPSRDLDSSSNTLPVRKTDKSNRVEKLESIAKKQSSSNRHIKQSEAMNIVRDSSSKKCKKKQREKISQLSAILAREAKQRSGTSLTDFLKQV